MLTAVLPIFLLFIQSLLNRLKPLYDRFIIRDTLISGKIKEVFAKDSHLSMKVWFNIDFWKALRVKQFFALGSLAAFKLFTFPLGVWIGSFSLVTTYPMSNLIGNLMAFGIHPLMLFIANKGLNEFVVNTKTMTGFGIVMFSLALGAVGWYLIYSGGQS